MTRPRKSRDETFREACRVGLWTKTDSVIQSDDFAIASH
jgi:hypothetical protein